MTLLSFSPWCSSSGNSEPRGLLSAFDDRETALKNGKLLIHPVDPDCIFNINKIILLLDSIDFISFENRRSNGTFPAGDRFLQLVTFMGCSPHIRFEPEHPDDDDYCYIRLIETESPLLLVSDNSRTPGCPECRKPALSDWSLLEQQTTPLVCQHCGTELMPETLRWRSDAGMARLFIEINSIFPGEAQPVEGLMQQLGDLTGCEWRYFYLMREKESRRKKPPEAS